MTGAVTWSPEEPEDGLLRAAFDAHQRRDGRPGPDAAAELTRRVESASLITRTVATPWLLTSDKAQLLERWLDERVDAALESTSLEGGPDPAQALTAWRERRLAQLAAGDLSVVVEHVDLLVIPPDAPTPSGSPDASTQSRRPAARP